jgi:hypothetical protein
MSSLLGWPEENTAIYVSKVTVRSAVRMYKCSRKFRNIHPREYCDAALRVEVDVGDIPAGSCGVQQKDSEITFAL